MVVPKFYISTSGTTIYSGPAGTGYHCLSFPILLCPHAVNSESVCYISCQILDSSYLVHPLYSVVPQYLQLIGFRPRHRYQNTRMLKSSFQPSLSAECASANSNDSRS